jgi:hypothetical protein
MCKIELPVDELLALCCGLMDGLHGTMMDMVAFELLD